MFGFQHLLMVALTFGLAFGAMVFTRRNPDSRGVSAISWALLTLMLASYPLKLWSAKVANWPTMPLPLHLCDCAAIIGAVALVTRNRLLVEITYFWGLAGTLQGLITPDLAWAFPHPRFVAFFSLHGGVVITAIFLTAGLRLYPRKWSVLWSFAALQLYAVTVFLVNWSTKSNYGFLMAKPDRASLLDHLGPPPWHILSLELVALVFFGLLYLPFVWRKRRERQLEAG